MTRSIFLYFSVLSSFVENLIATPLNPPIIANVQPGALIASSNGQVNRTLSPNALPPPPFSNPALIPVGDRHLYEYRVPNSQISIELVLSTEHPVDRQALGRTIFTAQQGLRLHLSRYGNSWLALDDDPYEVDDRRSGKCMIEMKSAHIGSTYGKRLTYRGVLDVLGALWEVLYMQRRSYEAIYQIINGTLQVGTGRVAVGKVGAGLRVVADE
ncbi:MAG: hypothetical protein Q9178_005754 [Gyalolechia marmorata]